MLNNNEITTEKVTYVAASALRFFPSDVNHPLHSWKDSPRLAVAANPDAAFLQSIKEFGIISPVLAFAVTNAEGKKEYIVAAGRRRVGAAVFLSQDEKYANIRVPVILRPYDETDATVAQMIENNLRTENSPLTTAYEMYHAVNSARRSYEEVASAAGVSHQTVRNWVALHTMPAVVKKAVEAGRISPTVAFGYNTKAFKKPGANGKGETWDAEKIGTALKKAIEDARLNPSGKVKVKEAKAAKDPKAVVPPTKEELRRLALSPSTPEDFSLVLQAVIGLIPLAEARDRGEDLAWLVIPEKPKAAKAAKGGAKLKKGGKKSPKVTASDDTDSEEIASEDVTDGGIGHDDTPFVSDSDLNDLFGAE